MASNQPPLSNHHKEQLQELFDERTTEEERVALHKAEQHYIEHGVIPPEMAVQTLLSVFLVRGMRKRLAADVKRGIAKRTVDAGPVPRAL